MRKKREKIVLSHPTGNANVRAVLEGLYSAKLLHSFHTSIATYPKNIFNLLSLIPGGKEFLKRTYSPYIQPYTKLYPYRELGRMLSKKINIKHLTAHEKGAFSVDRLYQTIDQKVANYIARQNDIAAVYAYEDGALATFKAAKERGLVCVYDLPIAYWEYSRKLMEEEALRLPNWAVTLGGGIKDSKKKRERKIEELQLADTIVCPSIFVQHSLPEWAKQKKCILSPFGTPKVNLDLFQKNTDINRPLRILFVGSMGQRKGLADLFEAVKLLNTSHVELVILGSLLAPMEFYRNEFSRFRYESTRLHKDVLNLMQTCDVFCLPSIVEGRALVMQEAMSQALPLIITANSGGEDLIEEGTGFLVSIRSPLDIAEKIEWFLDNRSSVRDMGAMAQQKATEYTWERYVKQIIQHL